MEYTQQMVSAAAVLALLGAFLWWMRRHGFAPARSGRTPGRRLQSLEHLVLAPQHTLHLVRVGEEALVVACSPAGCTLLDRVPARQLAALAEARS